MKYLIKMLPVLAVATMLLSSAHSADKEHYQPLPKDLQKEAYSIPASVEVAGSWDFFLKADFIYWVAKRDGTEYAVSTKKSYIYPPYEGTTLRPKAKWRPGVKVALGSTFDYDDWSLEAQWTYLLGKARGSATAPTSGYLKLVNSAFMKQFYANGAASASENQKTHREM